MGIKSNIQNTLLLQDEFPCQFWAYLIVTRHSWMMASGTAVLPFMLNISFEGRRLQWHKCLVGWKYSLVGFSTTTFRYFQLQVKGVFSYSDVGSFSLILFSIIYLL
jgi:hypothetical protein